VLDRRDQPVREFEPQLLDAIRTALADGLIEGMTEHVQQKHIVRVVRRLDEYWRRSGGTIPAADPAQVRKRIASQLADVTSFAEFLAQPISLQLDEAVSEGQRATLDELPDSVPVLGDRVPLRYELDRGEGVVCLVLREKQAVRLRTDDLPQVDRRIVFAVHRGRHELLRAHSLPQLKNALRRTRPVRGRYRGNRRH
jgi:hypothetical protein